ncbi:hypothetical protein BJ980_002453 [Nocardioides daedukensis]|uniref:DUF6457 domain-containing protein n=1 Tax=Nocardioides daedukensis TaxID=634462 RepID=A0A7Y9S083_9ACTN|nr:hypothetical protein [Nocardioides daedukensis]
MNLHDWIDELCDVLDIETELDEALVLDLARAAAHNVVRPAAPLTTYLLGYAAGVKGASVEEIEQLAARAQTLADHWEQPAGAPDPDDVNDPVPDDTGVDHTGDVEDLEDLESARP